MESGLLNAFHDDQYDNGNNYMKYELDNNYWSNENNSTLGIQLSETLNGILPITPNDDKLHYFNDDELNFQYSVDIDHTNNKITHSYDNETFSIIDENLHSSSSIIEVIPIDPNREYCYSPINLQTSNDTTNYLNNDDDNEIDETISNSSESSKLTFRSRTDSSSIGDYESHSSDEDSEFCDIVINQPFTCDKTTTKTTENNLNKISEINQDEKLKIEKVCLNNLVYDKKVCLNLVNDKKVCLNNIVNDKKVVNNSNYFLRRKVTEHKKDINTDESDIDIETIGENKIQSNSNKNNKLIETKPINKKYPIRNLHKTKNKKEICQKKATATTGDKKSLNVIKEKIVEKTLPTKNKNSPIKILNKKLVQAGLRGTNIAVKTKNKINVNNKLICQQICNKLQNELSSKETIAPVSIIKDVKLIEETVVLNNEVSIEIKQPIKRKLNLEEYKRRRNGISGPSLFHDHNSSDSTSSSLTNSTISSINTITSTTNNINDSKANEILELNRILNNKCEQKQMVQKNIVPPNPNSLLKKSFYYMAANQEKSTDPITEAKNKVLRMQELKRKAIQKRLIDITVSAKVGPVTKILPLEEIVRNSNNQNYSNPAKLISEYEEIIIVSIGCNTDLHIPPLNKTFLDGAQSSSSLLVISDTLKKVNTNNEQLKISNQSLITSIQNVVFQKSVVVNVAASDTLSQTAEKSNEIVEHGEDKIIMHLRKDRIRAKTNSISTQTDFIPEFPQLELFITHFSNNLSKQERLNRRKYRSQKNSYSENETENYVDHNYCGNSNKTLPTNIEQSVSSSNSDYTVKKANYKDKTMQKIQRRSTSSELSDYDRNRSWAKRSRSSRNSYSKSPSRSRQRSRSISRSRTRSRSRSRSYSRRTTNRNRTKKNNRNHSPAVEERRIVYVGRIEDETNKDDLRKKFISYGPIKNVTIHFKDTGMKYGFVTYDRAGDAFKAIDNSSNDDNIKMYDISFGGRRGFCRSMYADLDGAATNYYQEYSYGNQYQEQYKPSKNDEEDSFEALLQKVKKKIVNTKQNQQTEHSNNNYYNNK